jgi:hypothetical protein
MAARTLLRGLFVLTGVGLTVILAGSMVWAQELPPLSNKWAPGAVPGGGGIHVAAVPIVTGEPFTADNDSRSVMLLNGEKVINESHSIIARDSSGRVATRTVESPHVTFPNGKSAGSIPAGGTITDPTASVHLNWSEPMEAILGKVVMKNRLFPNEPQARPQPLDACERESGRTRHYQNGVTQQIEEIGERTIQNILTRGCRVTNFIPAGTPNNDQPITTTDESWSSPELRITLLHVFHAPDGQDRMEQLDNIVLGEPDPALFEPPPGYTIRDMDAEREQQERAQFTVQPGQPDAAMLVGAWEADDPFAAKPAQVGIRLKLVANRRVPFSHGKVTGDGMQKFMSFDICVYQRAAGEEKHGWFSTTQGGASWDGSRLIVAYHGAGTYAFVQGDLALDLTFDEQKGFWAGSYSRDGVSKPVRLTRPGAARNGPSNPFVGDWSESGRMGPSAPAALTPTCVDIAQGLDGTFVAWRLSNSGPIIDPREGDAIALLQENDGDALGVQINGDTLTLQEGIDWAVIAGKGPEQFTGKLSADGIQIVGTWAAHAPESGKERPASPDENHSPTGPVTTFTKMVGQSCWAQGKSW